MRLLATLHPDPLRKIVIGKLQADWITRRVGEAGESIQEAQGMKYGRVNADTDA